jgi:hypothetical protein
MESVRKVFARLAFVALVAALLTNGAVAQEDPAPSQAHLIVHKVRVTPETPDAKRSTEKSGSCPVPFAPTLHPERPSRRSPIRAVTI